MDEFVFDSFVRKGLSGAEMALEFPDFKKGFKGQINEGYFSEEYCNSYMKKLRSRMIEERVSRKLGFTKEKDFKTTILKRFARNRGTWAFLPQENIAKVWGCSQRTVSRYLKKMIDEGYLILDKKHNRLAKKAAEYRLGHNGSKLLLKAFGMIVDTVDRVANRLTELLLEKKPNKEEQAKEHEKFREQWRAFAREKGQPDPFPEPPPRPEGYIPDIPF